MIRLVTTTLISTKRCPLEWHDCLSSLATTPKHNDTKRQHSDLLGVKSMKRKCRDIHSPGRVSSMAGKMASLTNATMNLCKNLIIIQN